MSDTLTDDEMALWVSWKRACDDVWEAVVREIGITTGLSAADFSVLTRVVEVSVPPRQQQLADALGWQRSRLSRQLTRMEERGLVERITRDATPIIRPTAAGRAVAARARTAHARAVRVALLTRTPHAPATAFWKTIRGLGADSPARH